MRLGLFLVLTAACFAFEHNVGFLMSRDISEAANGKLRCYVGIVTNYNSTSIGTEVLCNGLCGSISSTAGGYNFTTYNCFPPSFCTTANLTEACTTLTLDRDLTGCCCGTDNCNVAGTSINTTIPIAAPEEPIACYSGIAINGVTQSGSDWVACQGDCMSLTINSTMNGNPIVASIYACDPTSVCTALGIENRCHHIEPAVRGCCCGSDACINPTMNPPKEPRGPLSCYVGLYSKAANISVGQEVFCEGKCASLSSTVAGGDIVVFECTQKAVCQYLQLYDNCQTISADRDITGCCCDNVNNCNAANYSLGEPRPRWEGDFPVACFNGIRVNGNFIAPPSWSACFGDCASVMVNTTMAMTPMSAEIFTCDPASVCNQLGMVNNCTTVEPGVSGCCCSYDACLDPTKYPNKYPGTPLKCYVGFQSTYNGGMSVGSEVYCNGMCGALNTLVNGENVTTYMCTPRQICRQLELWDEWKRLPLDREVNALCCDNFNNCNVRDPSVNTSQPMRRRPEFPITCFNGIQVNGQWVTMAGWQSCNGDCASINITTAAMGLSHVLTLYTCDPTAVCASLNMTNTCTTVEPGVSGCCCNTNGCIDPTKYPPKTPANKLQCYVGLYAINANINVGAEVYCSGKCAALRALVNGDDVTSFHCVPTSICRSLELDDACMRIPGDRDVRACCCDNLNSCNVYIANKTDVVIPQPSPVMEYPISCWNGIYLNGAPLTEVGFQNCNGQCASITLNTTYNGAMQSASIYSCDPTSVCKALNMTNTCAVVEEGLGGCCCNTDACIYPLRNRNPGNPLLCFVGLYAPNANIKVGAEVACDGQCSVLSGVINGDNVASFQCAPLGLCQSLELDNTCSQLAGDRDIKACCCDSGNSCNAANYTDITPPTPAPVAEYPISCWTGIYVNGNPVTSAGFRTCYGECASITLQTTAANATMYMCDPTSVCRSLNMTNQCSTIETGLSGCCCNTDACLNPQKSPGNPLTCYVGMYAMKANINTGSEVYCDGKCSSLRATVNGDDVTTFQCISLSACKYLALNNGCTTLYGDREVTACCCDYANACNVANRTDIVAPTPSPVHEFPISCWSGVYVNGNAITNAGFQTCFGECASVSLTTVIGNATHNAAIYTCDPTSVCNSVGMINNCITVETGVQGCCCNTDGCLTPNKKPGNILFCYVGLYAKNAGINVGAEVACDGQCSSVSGLVNGDSVTTFQCVPASICKSLALKNSCGSLPGDREVQGCCCDQGNSCNLYQLNRTDIVPPTPIPAQEFPISCWAGIYVNGNAITSAGFQTCFGECASITMQTTLNNQQHNATVYMCDPTSVCQALNMSNACATVEPGLSGCCCNDDGCLTPRKSPSSNPLMCYVGINAPLAGVNVGAVVPCVGMCSSLNGIVNGDNVTTFQCAPTSVCKSLSAYNGCNTLQGDREVTGCCCDTQGSCNLANRPDIPMPTPSPVSEYPISCWSGLYVNGNAISNTGFTTCFGDCASITLNTTVGNVAHTASMYMCDPTSICRALNMSNQCSNVEAGLGGCCCNTDNCLNPLTNTFPGNDLICYVGIYHEPDYHVGSEMKCSGKCASLQTTIGGTMLKSYHCAPTSVCKALTVDNSCGPVYKDSDVVACCCDNTKNCNVKEPISTNTTVPAFTGTPIACQSGIYVDGDPITTDNTFIACKGQCAKVTYPTNITGTAHTLDIYTCDPVSVCSALGMANSCISSMNGTAVSGCCCSYDGCVTPSVTPTTGSGSSLSFFVAIFAAVYTISRQ